MIGSKLVILLRYPLDLAGRFMQCCRLLDWGDHSMKQALFVARMGSLGPSLPAGTRTERGAGIRSARSCLGRRPGQLPGVHEPSGGESSTRPRHRMTEW